ncbi:hypothetical protein KR038_007763, partial [Drosophila bunnanda]
SFQIIVFATLLVAVALAMQPLNEDNSRNPHLNHKRQLSQHHHKDLHHELKEHHKQGKNLPHLAAHNIHAKSTSQRKGRQAHSEHGHSKSHHQHKQQHLKSHHSTSRKARSNSKHHHKRHSGSRHH